MSTELDLTDILRTLGGMLKPAPVDPNSLKARASKLLRFATALDEAVATIVDLDLCDGGDEIEAINALQSQLSEEIGRYIADVVDGLALENVKLEVEAEYRRATEQSMALVRSIQGETK